MRVLTSMSDIRTKLLLGTSIGALAMMFVMAAGVDAFDNKTATAVQSGSIMGHVTVMAIHPDGSAQYAQADNTIIQGPVLTQAILNMLDPGFTQDTFNCIQIGDGTNAGVGINSALNGGAVHVCDTNGVTVNGDGDVTVTTAHTIVDDDVTPVIIGTAVITEAVLEDAGGLVLSSVGLAADVGVISGSVITINYQMVLT